MYTIQGYDKENVQEIYKNIIMYSIYKYETLNEEIKPLYARKHQNALEAKDDLKIVEEKDFNTINEFLREKKDEINQMRSENQEVINIVSDQIVETLKSLMPSNLSDIEKCEYIVDYVTNTMNYSTDWHKYCKSVPPVDGYDFDFYNGVPLSSSFEGLLVTRQGLCDDIANLITYLGKQLGVDIRKLICDHNGNRHAINYIVTTNNESSYIDATSIINKTKNKDNAFLVSEERLNENNDYKIEDKRTSISIKKSESRYAIDEIINKTNLLLPTIIYQEEQYNQSK